MLFKLKTHLLALGNIRAFKIIKHSHSKVAPLLKSELFFRISLPMSIEKIGNLGGWTLKYTLQAVVTNKIGSWKILQFSNLIHTIWYRLFANILLKCYSFLLIYNYWLLSSLALYLPFPIWWPCNFQTQFVPFGVYFLSPFPLFFFLFFLSLSLSLSFLILPQGTTAIKASPPICQCSPFLIGYCSCRQCFAVSMVKKKGRVFKNVIAL